jgi:hypothetical protein
VKAASGSDSASPFSAELRSEVSAAIEDYRQHRGPESEARLRAVTERVCAEAHALDLPPEKMLIAIKKFYAILPYSNTTGDWERREAFDRFVSGCIEAYFGGQSP